MATEAEVDLDARGSTTSLTGRSSHLVSCGGQSGIRDIGGTANKASSTTIFVGHQV